MTEDKLEKLKAMIEELNNLAVRIQELDQKKNKRLKRLKEIRDELPKIEEEEKVKMEIYKRMGIKYRSKLQEIKEEEKEITKQVSQIDKESKDLIKKFLYLFLEGGYPLLDLENPEVTGSQVIFPIKEGFRLLRATYEVLLKITWNRTELFIDGVKFEEDRWIVDTDNRIKAMKKVKEILDTLENSVRDILNIDEICERRIRKSKSWGPALQLLYITRGPLTPKDVAKRLGWNINYASATLTNLMKKEFWPVPLVERPSKGVYRLNGHGYVIMRRYEQLYGITIKREEQYEENSQSVKRKTLLNFMKT